MRPLLFRRQEMIRIVWGRSTRRAVYLLPASESPRKGNVLGYSPLHVVPIKRNSSTSVYPREHNRITCTKKYSRNKDLLLFWRHSFIFNVDSLLFLSFSGFRWDFYTLCVLLVKSPLKSNIKSCQHNSQLWNILYILRSKTKTASTIKTVDVKVVFKLQWSYIKYQWTSGAGDGPVTILWPMSSKKHLLHASL